MDPLTHTLVGASLASTRLGRTTRRAFPALIIGANLPDIDVLAYFGGGDAALAFRRGWTHGVLALVVLPPLLTLILWAVDRWRAGSDDSTPLRPGWLAVLAYLAVGTHPALDWLNTYGMRWWMPFEGTWYYGDSVFIIDPWLWLILGTGWLAGRRPTRRLFAVWVIITALLLTMVLLRAPEYAPVVVAVLLALLLVLLWKPGSRQLAARTASLGLSFAAIFIIAMIATHRITEGAVERYLRAHRFGAIDQLMVGPLPLDPFTWEFVVRSDGRLRHGRYSWLAAEAIELSSFDRADARASEVWPEIAASGQIPGFLGWARFPWIDNEPRDRGSISVLDARYTRVPTRGFGGVEIQLSSRDHDAGGAGNESRP